jgi:leucine dehydrogenase
MSVFEHPAFSNHEDVRFYNDEQSGLKAIIAVHNTNLGASLGGCRMWPYATSEEALADVLNLSKGMTYKAAMANLKQGGGKAVIIGDPRQQKTEALFKAMGRFVDSFNGSYITAEDSGISVADLKIVETQTQHVSGTHASCSYDGQPADGNPSPATAYGVYMGIKATVKHKWNDGLKGKRIAIQGLGNVGINLARLLYQDGAILYVADIFPDNLQKAQQLYGATIVSPDEILKIEVDVLAPCALGGAVNQESIEAINAGIVAGAANNQLTTEALGQALFDKGILYAPDYVINGGGIIDIFYNRTNGTSEAMKAHLDGIGDTLVEIYQRAESEGIATNIIANQIADERFHAN